MITYVETQGLLKKIYLLKPHILSNLFCNSHNNKINFI